MKVSFATVLSAFFIVLLCQFSFGMENPKFISFSELAIELQSKIMRYSDNFVSIQQINKQWCSETSLKTPHIFDGYKVKIDRSFFVINGYGYQLDNNRMKRIFITATYNKNYDGVKNMLQAQDIKKLIDDTNLHFTIFTNNIDGYKTVIDPYNIAKYNDDQTMLSIFDENKNVELSLEKIEDKKIKICNPSDEIMACFLGDSDFIKFNEINSTDEEKENLFRLALKCDHEEYIAALTRDIIYDTNIGEMVDATKGIRLFLKKEYLERACDLRKLKVLDVLLAINHFDLNKIENDSTLLEKYSKLAEENFAYNDVVLLLKKYGAKTVAELEQDDKDATEVISRLSISSACTIL